MSKSIICPCEQYILEVEMGNPAEKISSQPDLIVMTVDSSKIVSNSEFWMPEVLKLSGEIATVIETKLSSLPVDDEELLVEIKGFPGLNEIRNTFTQKAQGAERMSAFFPQEIVKALKSKGIQAAEIYNKGQAPREKSSVVVRQFIRHGERYAQDLGKPTYSYQDSVFQYFVTRLK